MGSFGSDTSFRSALVMIKGQQIIEIGGVRCSIGFEDGFFQKEFALVLSDYRRCGFCSEGESDINKNAIITSIPPFQLL